MLAQRVHKLHSFPEELPDLPLNEIKRRLGREYVIKLSFNESPYGPPPAALTAAAATAASFKLYHDAYCRELTAKLAARYHLKSSQFLIGNGADEVIILTALTFLQPGDEVLIPSPTFGAYAAAAHLTGAEPVPVPLRDFCIDPAAVAAHLTERTKMIFLCNPNNPTGTALTAEEIVNFIKKVPDNVVVVVDEAYNEYTDDPAAYSLISHLDCHPYLLVIRTFSKIYALAALRVGYLIGREEVIAAVHRVRPPFNVNGVAQAAAAAAVTADEFIAQIRKLNREQREFLSTQLAALGWRVMPSQANFILVDTGIDSQPLFEYLVAGGIIVRPGHGFGLPTCLRITVGRAEENEYVVEKCRAFLKGVSP